jgi:hypothetical protein
LSGKEFAGATTKRTLILQWRFWARIGEKILRGKIIQIVIFTIVVINIRTDIFIGPGKIVFKTKCASVVLKVVGTIAAPVGLGIWLTSLKGPLLPG